jgi:small subunit ribosomal protein S21
MKSPLTPFTTRAYTQVTHLQEVWLAEVIIGENESFESALKRFTKRVQQDGILAEARRREHYEKPSVRRKKKAAAKRRKSRKAVV